MTLECVVNGADGMIHQALKGMGVVVITLEVVWESLESQIPLVLAVPGSLHFQRVLR